MNLLLFVDLFAIFFFALSGSVAGMKKGIDWFGIIFMGFITAVGGASVRDLFLGMRPVWISHNAYIPVALFGSCLALSFSAKIPRFKKPIVVIDTLGISLATLVGVEKSLAAGAVPAAAIFFGVLSSICGGIMRDAIRNEVPIVFRRELYATACVAGAVLFWLLINNGVENYLAYIIGSGSIILIRYLAVRYDIHLPYIGEPGTHILKSKLER